MGLEPNQQCESADVLPTTQRDRRIPVVLHIEDDPTSRALMERIAERVDHFVALINASNGTDALALLERCTPDLVLLDLDLPDMDGRDILQAIRSQTKTAAVQVVVVSGQKNPDVVAALLAMGADSYITEPFEVAKIIEVLSSLVSSTYEQSS